MKLLDAIAHRLGYMPRVRRLRAWAAAKINRLTAGWLIAQEPINRQISNNLSALRVRSREQAQNNDYMQRFLQLVQANVVGHQGIILQAKAKDMDGSLDSAANEAIEAAWKEWGRMGVCDATGRYSWRAFQRQWVRAAAMDGEVFVYLERESRLNQFGLVVRFFDPESVDATLNIDRLQNGNRVITGVELDPGDRPVAYLVRGMRAPDFFHNGRKYRRVPADDVIHAYLHEWVHGMRGVPWVAQSLFKMGMLDGMMEAELVASRAAASKMGFFVEEDGGRYTGDDEESDGDLVTNVEPGTFERLPGGVTFQQYDPNHPTDAFEPFVKSSLRGIAAGLGVSYNSLANDLESVNYSSLRQGAIEERALWMLLQDWMIEVFADRVYRVWLIEALKRRAIVLANGGRLRLESMAKYYDVSWQPRRWQWVDPASDIEAAERSIQLGIKSRSDVIREQGRDPEDVWLEIAAEQDRMRELGILNNEEQADAEATG